MITKFVIHKNILSLLSTLSYCYRPIWIMEDFTMELFNFNKCWFLSKWSWSTLGIPIDCSVPLRMVYLALRYNYGKHNQSINNKKNYPYQILHWFFDKMETLPSCVKITLLNAIDHQQCLIDLKTKTDNMQSDCRTCPLLN